MKKIITLLLSLLFVVAGFAQAATNVSKNEDVLLHKNFIAENANNTTEEKLSKPIEIYPNPAKESFCIYNIDGIVSVEMYSVNGKIVLIQDVSEGETIHIGHLPNGIYLVKINKEVYKVIKK